MKKDEKNKLDDGCSNMSSSSYDSMDLKHILRTIGHETRKKRLNANSAVAAHLSPIRLIKFSEAEVIPTDDELRHLSCCEECKLWHSVFQLKSQRQWLHEELPDELRNRIRQDQFPTIFPDGTISKVSWQFGLIELLKVEKPDLFDRLINIIADRLVRQIWGDVLSPKSETKTVVLAAFGSVVNECARRATQRFARMGYPHVNVVKIDRVAVDSENEDGLRFHGSPVTFRGATVIVLCDVADSGKLLERMAKRAQNLSSGGWVRRIAFISKVGQENDEVEYESLWSVPRADRLPFDQFRKMEPRVANTVSFFDAELGRSIGPLNLSSRAIDSLLLKNGVIEFGREENGMYYPFFINTLRLLGIEHPKPHRAADQEFHSQQLAMDFHCSQKDGFNAETKECVRKLIEILRKNQSSACLVYHKRKAGRAGVIAQHLSKCLKNFDFNVPAIEVGWSTGSIFILTDKQRRKLQEHQTIVMIDAVMRTGGELAAIYNVIKDSVPGNKEIIGFVIAAAEEYTIINAADSVCSDGFCVHSFLKLPLLPSSVHVFESIRKFRREAQIFVENLNSSDRWQFSLFDFKVLLSPDEFASTERPVCSLAEPTRFVSLDCLSSVLRPFLKITSSSQASKFDCALSLLALGDYTWICDAARRIADEIKNGQPIPDGKSFLIAFLFGLLWLKRVASGRDANAEFKAFADECFVRSKAEFTRVSQSFVFPDIICESQEISRKIETFVELIQSDNTLSQVGSTTSDSAIFQNNPELSTPPNSRCRKTAFDSSS